MGEDVAAPARFAEGRFGVGGLTVAGRSGLATGNTLTAAASISAAAPISAAASVAGSVWWIAAAEVAAARSTPLALRRRSPAVGAAVIASAGAVRRCLGRVAVVVGAVDIVETMAVMKTSGGAQRRNWRWHHQKPRRSLGWGLGLGHFVAATAGPMHACFAGKVQSKARPHLAKATSAAETAPKPAGPGKLNALCQGGDPD